MKERKKSLPGRAKKKTLSDKKKEKKINDGWNSELSGCTLPVISFSQGPPSAEQQRLPNSREDGWGSNAAA